ncbi:channel protein TolC, partial [Methylobacterium sp. WL2]
MESALSKAYQGNPSLNAGRAGVRAIDENVAIAQAGYRPQVNVGASIGVQYLQTRSGSSVSAAAGATSTGASTASTGTTAGGTTGASGASGLGGASAGGTTGIGVG